MESEDDSSPEAIKHSSDDQYVPDERTLEPKLFNQQELNDHIRDISLSKDKAEFLVSSLEETLTSLSKKREMSEFATAEYGIAF